MVIIEKGFLCVPIITRGEGGEGAFSHGAILFAITAQGVGVHSGKYTIHKVTVISS